MIHEIVLIGKKDDSKPRKAKKDIRVWWLIDFIHLPFASHFSYPADAITSVINICQSGKYALVSRHQEFSTDFTIGGKKVKINPNPRILKSRWVVYNEGINLPSGNQRVRLSLPQFPSTNLIVNPSFEEKDITPWSGASDIIDESYQGKSSLRVYSAKNSQATVFQAKIPGFEKSKYYFYSFRYKIKSGRASTGIWQPPYSHYVKPVIRLTGEKDKWESHQEIFYPAPKTGALDIYLYVSAKGDGSGEVLRDGRLIS